MVEKNSKRLANLSLFVATAGYIGTLSLQSKGFQIVSGGFEAALVGGLADWFAVTAMFRHPLGIPIPHTALLPKNREKITDSILHTLNDQWLSKESLYQKVEEENWIEKGILSFEKMMENNESKEKIIDAIQQVGSSISGKSIENFIQSTITPMIHSIDSQKIWSTIVDQVLENKWEENTYEFLLNKLEEYVRMPEVKEIIGQEIIQFIERKFFMVKAFIPMIGEAKITEFVHGGLLDLLSELKDPTSNRRKIILAFVRQEAEKSKTNELVIRQLESWKNKGFHYIVKEGIKFINNKISNKEFIEKTLIKSINFIKSSNWLEKLEKNFKKLLMNTIDKYHNKIGELVRNNIEKLSTEEITVLLENKIGKDITWIRVNGAVCGFIIGIILTSLRMLFT